MDSGQLMPGEDWGFEDNDETDDYLPPQPRDWNRKYIIYTVCISIDNTIILHERL